MHDDRGPALLPVAATLLALAGVRSGETVVDVGCGAGLLTHSAAAAAGPGGRVFGVDRDPAPLVAARARRASPVRWVCADPAALPFADGRVDKLVCGTELPRLTDSRPALAEWARVLRPGGRLATCAWGDGGAGLPALLAGAGLALAYEAADDVTLPFRDAGAYTRWRVAFAAAAAVRVDGLGGPGPVLAHARVHYVAATRT